MLLLLWWWGHCFPVWLNFKGGKGVATSLAALAALDLYIGGIFVSVWLITALVSRYSSLSALLAMLACVGAGLVVLDDIIAQIAVLFWVLLFGAVTTQISEDF